MSLQEDLFLVFRTNFFKSFKIFKVFKEKKLILFVVESFYSQARSGSYEAKSWSWIRVMLLICIHNTCSSNLPNFQRTTEVSWRRISQSCQPSSPWNSQASTHIHTHPVVLGHSQSINHPCARLQDLRSGSADVQWDTRSFSSVLSILSCT